MSTTNFVLSNDDKIALLQELHRPLEEHWSVKTKFGLDPKSSEYIYKHHITRLQDIYTTQRQDYSQPPGLLFMSPVSQLYGVNGLNVSHDETKLKRKEDKWVSNFQKHSFLSDNKPEGGVESRDRSKSPLRSRSPGPHSRSNHRHNASSVEDSQTNSNKSIRRVCYDPTIAPEDLVMLGLYRLDERQQEIYRNFVEMLGGFDEYDRGNILEDALKDAQGEEDVLDGYGGTTLPQPPLPHSGGPGRPSTAPQQARAQSPNARTPHGMMMTAGAGVSANGMSQHRPNTAEGRPPRN